MKRFKILSVFLCVILLLAACGPAAPAALTPAPYLTVPPSTAAPSLSPLSSFAAREGAAGLYSGPYDSSILPMSIPQISEADRKTFNPERINDYLATSPKACYDYQIVDWEVKDGSLYLTVSACLYFWVPDDAYYYIKDAFALTDEEMRRIPFFFKCIAVGNSLSIGSELGGYIESVLGPIPVADDASICLPSDYDPDINTVQEFIDEIVNGKNQDSIPLVSFSYENGQITKIFSEEEYEEGDENDYEDEGDYEDGEGDYEDGEGDYEDGEGDYEDGEGDYEDGEGDYEDGEGDWDYPDEVMSPHAYGFGSLPYTLLGIEPVPAENYDSDKIIDYLLANTSEFDDFYMVDSAKQENGKLYLYLTDSVSIDADIAYQYLKTTFSLSDDDILALPLFSENNCAFHNGKMYTPEGWDFENGTELDDGGGDNCIDLKDIALPDPVPVASDAAIFLVDYGYCFTDGEDFGCIITAKQFKECLLSDRGDDLLEYLSNLWFKCSNGEITAIAEEYAP